MEQQSWYFKFMIEKMQALLGESRVLKNELLKSHTTFNVGGPCRALLIVESIDELSKVLSALKSEGASYFFIGNGSNLLVSDKGYDGFVIKLAGDFLSIENEGERLICGAGAILSKVCRCARDVSLSGLEFAYGIPGTIGGALVMNAGAYDGEMKNVVESVTLMDEGGNVCVKTGEEMLFGYRDSVLKHDNFIALGAVLKLTKGDVLKIDEKMSDFMGRRRDKQPLEYPSAGSTFKRPEGYFAGKLIQDSNLSGARVGGACVSTKHCGFVINDNNATAKDIDELMKLVSKKVKEGFGVELEPEVIKIGEFD